MISMNSNYETNAVRHLEEQNGHALLPWPWPLALVLALAWRRSRDMVQCWAAWTSRK